MTKSAQVWVDVLDRIERSLQQWLQRVREPEPLAPPPSRGEPLSPDREKDRLCGWLTCLEAADRVARDADERLAREQVALHEARQRLREVRENLVEWVTRRESL
jgi:hypothetical protein